MARRIEPSREALADFDQIYDGLARRNELTAADVLRKLDRAIQRLVDQPRLGRPYVHGRRKLRLLTHGEYLVFYTERPGVIELVRVINGRRNIPDVLDEL
jgi:plasmid stabilization system protein ParE